WVQIGLDARGRIWLAWLDHRDYPHAARGVPRLFELDRSSLAPRTAPLAVPGVVADRLKLACADSCRVVAQTDHGDIVSWAARGPERWPRSPSRTRGRPRTPPRASVGRSCTGRSRRVVSSRSSGSSTPLRPPPSPRSWAPSSLFAHEPGPRKGILIAAPFAVS